MKYSFQLLILLIIIILAGCAQADDSSPIEESSSTSSNEDNKEKEEAIQKRIAAIQKRTDELRDGLEQAQEAYEYGDYSKALELLPVEHVPANDEQKQLVEEIDLLGAEISGANAQAIFENAEAEKEARAVVAREDFLQNAFSINVNQFEKAEYPENTYDYSFTVQNTSDIDIRSLTLKISFLNSQGQSVTSETSRVFDLYAGESKVDRGFINFPDQDLTDISITPVDMFE